MTPDSVTYGGTRRCSYCRKVALFSVYRCKHCRYRCRRKCSGHNHRRNNSHKSLGGDEHWTKVLQANEVNANVTLLLGDGGAHLPCWARARALLSADTRRHSVDPGLLASVYQRVCRWFAATRRHLHRDFRRTSHCVSSDEHRQAALTGGESSPRCPPSGAAFKFQLTSASSDDSGVDTSTCSSLTSASPASTTGGDPCRPCGEHDAPRVDGACANAATNIRTDACCMRAHLTTTLSCPSNRKVSAQSMAAGRDKETMCATWPQSGKSTSVYEDEILTSLDVDYEENVFDEDADGRCHCCGGDGDETRYTELHWTLRECSIPYEDLVFGECIRVGRRQNIYRGRWHGDVMIHSFRELSEQEVRHFWEEVCKLSRIRHENIALFMGACVKEPHLAVVTSVQKGVSLYEHIHIREEKVGVHLGISITRQVAQGMGYLHARGIVIRKLNSKNIFLDTKVKLCLMDYGMAEKRHDRSNRGCIPRGHLTYIAPEVLTTLRVMSPKIQSFQTCTSATNVYAFGTVLYEMITGLFPFHGTPTESIIWQVGSGQKHPLDHVKCSVTLKGLIERCWSHNPSDRWLFPDIIKELQTNVTMHKRHSLSQPERLNYSGLKALYS